MSNTIKLVLHIIHSRRDRSGNVYWAFTAQDTATGRSISGHISGGESNITSTFPYLGLESPEVSYTITELPIRQWDRTIKGWAYAGCPSQRIATFIKIGLGWSYPIEEFKVVNVAPDPRSHSLRPSFIYHLVSNAFRPEERVAFRAASSNTHEIGKVFTVTDRNFDDLNFDWNRIIKPPTKLFKIASISDNTNSFGLHGHILVGLDGEVWEVARARYDDTSWIKGAIIETDGKHWAELSCEIPHRRDNAPVAVVNEVWGT